MTLTVNSEWANGGATRQVCIVASYTEHFISNAISVNMISSRAGAGFIRQGRLLTQVEIYE